MISAGETGLNRVERGVCVKIMTGAPLPGGADAVVMVEDTGPLDGGRAVLVKRALSPGANVCHKGEDTKRGEKVLSAGCAIGAPEVAVLASIGVSEVGVARRPEVGVLSTGNEIVEPGTPLAPGMIRNSNGSMLSALARFAGGNVEYLGIAGDDVEHLRRSLGKGLGKDILLVSGGVSMGDYDLVPRVLGELGVEVLFHKVRVKPGKPLLFGRRGRCLVFGIPGNPVSSFVVFHLFVKPAFGRLTAYSGAAGIDGFGISRDGERRARAGLFLQERQDIRRARPEELRARASRGAATEAQRLRGHRLVRGVRLSPRLRERER